MNNTPPTPSYEPPRDHYLISAGGHIRSWLLTTDHKRIALLYLISVTVFFFIGGVFATMIRAKDLAFPKINLLSWYIYLIGGSFVLYSFSTGGLDTGWTFYTPLSSIYSNSAVTPAVLGIFINGFSSILTGLNFIVTIHTMRAPGMTWFRLPLFVWSHYATSLVMILGTPVVAITLLLAGLERMFHLGFFNPAMGGDPILFQHLFWFYSHPAVYIMVLPAMGVVSEIIPTFARKPIFGYSFIAASSIAIAVIGLFSIGGVTGLSLACLGLYIHIHDTYFVIAHFHYFMVGGAVMGYVGGLHYWWPKITGRLYPEALSHFAAIVLFLGFNLTFFP